MCQFVQQCKDVAVQSVATTSESDHRRVPSSRRMDTPSSLEDLSGRRFTKMTPQCANHTSRLARSVGSWMRWTRSEASS